MDVNGVTETNYYSGSLYEEVIRNSETKQINYIFAEGQSIAIFEKSNVSGEKLLYLLKDHLGTIQALTNESGSLVQELSYDAWGKRPLGGAAAGLSGAFLNGANFGQVTKSTFTGERNYN